MWRFICWIISQTQCTVEHCRPKSTQHPTNRRQPFKSSFNQLSVVRITISNEYIENEIRLWRKRFVYTRNYIQLFLWAENWYLNWFRRGKGGGKYDAFAPFAICKCKYDNVLLCFSRSDVSKLIVKAMKSTKHIKSSYPFLQTERKSNNVSFGRKENRLKIDWLVLWKCTLLLPKSNAAWHKPTVRPNLTPNTQEIRS